MTYVRYLTKLKLVFCALTSVDCILGMERTWIVRHKKRFRANIIVWGYFMELSTFEVRAMLSDIGLASFVAENIAWE